MLSLIYLSNAQNISVLSDFTNAIQAIGSDPQAVSIYTSACQTGGSDYWQCASNSLNANLYASNSEFIAKFCAPCNSIGSSKLSQCPVTTVFKAKVELDGYAVKPAGAVADVYVVGSEVFYGLQCHQIDGSYCYNQAFVPSLVTFDLGNKCHKYYFQQLLATNASFDLLYPKATWESKGWTNASYSGMSGASEYSQAACLLIAMYFQ